jgi:hypothetical protein
MLTNNPFYFSTIRNLVIGFGKLLNNIQIQKIRDNGTVERVIKVPLAYASADKTITMLQSQVVTRTKDLPEIKISLPRMSYEVIGISYDTTRMSQQLVKNVFKSTNPNLFKTQFRPVPYNVEFEVGIFVKYMDEGLQIIEQILPYFRPFYAITMNPIENIDMKIDIPITLTSISKEDTYEGAVEEDRIIQWTMNFTANAWVFPPITNAKVIKRATTNFFDLGNGQKISSTTVEVDPITANVDDNWTIKITRSE